MIGPGGGTTWSPATPEHGRLVPWDRVLELGLDDEYTLLGECDWGGCDREAWGFRWDYRSGQYLTVCQSCRMTTHLDRNQR